MSHDQDESAISKYGKSALETLQNLMSEDFHIAIFHGCKIDNYSPALKKWGLYWICPVCPVIP